MKTNQPTIGELLQHWARSTPASVALVAPGRKPLTYDAYGRQAEYVCETLSNWGIGRGDRVALVLPTGAEAGVCYVSVCSCATAAPLNPAYTYQEFSLYLARLSVKAAIVMRGNDTAARAVAANLEILLIELDPDYSGPAGTFQLSGGAPATRRRSGLPSADDLALVVQTSGTTSRSKIIPLTHLNVVARAMLENSFFGIGSKDRVLCLNALYHHSGLKQGVVEPLQSGGSTVGISAFGPADFLELLEEFNPTWCTGAATFFHEIMRIAPSRNADFRRHGLRFFRSGSARLLPSVANAIEETFGVPILNAYSSSETGTMTSNPPPPGVRRSETVGMPIGIDVSILDDDGNELPSGEPGEVAARGPTVMRGYEDDSEANAQSFCNGWFRTGDAGYFDESGYLVLTGRLKEVINRGGEKISPVEIDSVLETHPAVAEAAAFGVPHPTLGEVVVAAVVVKNGARLSEAEVKAQVRCHLSQFKVPRKVYFVDSLPRNASGKVQRSDLATAIGLGETVHTELKRLDQDRHAAARDLDGIAGPAASDHALPEKGLTIGSILRSHAARTPDALAILAPGRAPLSFAGLADQMRYVQETLAGWGIMPGERVAGLISKGPEMATACATIPEAATFAPLDPDLSVDDYASLFARIIPRALIIESGSEHHVRVAAERMGIAQIELIADPSAPAGTFAMALSDATIPFQRTAPRLRGMAYILNTSGTTSRRKIVPIQHSQLVARARAVKDWFQYRQTDLTLHLVPMYLGHGIMTSLMVPLLSGTSVVCPAKFDVDSFFMHLEEFKPTWFSAGFTVHRAILQRANDYQDIVARSRLRFIKSGSGRLSEMEIARLEELFDAPFLVPLSTTETHMIACNPLPPRVRKPDSVGLPVLHQVNIIGEGDEILGPGEQGEIVVRGPLLFSGYLDDDEANKRAFVDGWFRTGDLGWFDDDGYLYLSGRLKDIINRGGEKISPAEIDAVIEMHSAVAEAAAFGVPHPSLGEEVIAAVVARNGARLSEDEVKAQVRSHLSRIKVPRKVYFVDSLQRDASGKVQRNGLAAALGLSDVVHVEQQNEHKRAVEGSRQLAPLEAALAGLWARVLEIDHVDPDDNFFLLGGDSLRAATLFAEVDVAFGVTLPGEAIYDEGETVAGMAALIESLRVLSSEASDSHGIPIDGAAEIIREISHREKAEPIPLIAKNDLFIAATLIAAAAVACLPRHAVRPALCRLIAKKHISYYGSRTDRLNDIIPLLEDWASAEELEISFLTGSYEAIAETLRDYVPQKHPPKARLRGRAHIDAALAAGRGAVLWNFPTGPGSLAGLRCLADTGLQIAQLRAWAHPFSSSRFGLKFLNPVRNRIDDRYIKAPVILHKENAIEVMHALGAHLDANGVVRISASSLTGKPYEMPFLGGTLCLTLGAPTLAILHDAPLIPTFCIPDGAGGFDLIVEAPLTDGSEKATFERARALARQYAVILERYVKRHPQMWRCWYMPTTWRPGRTA